MNNIFRNYYDHRAKGIYIRIYDGNPADLKEIKDYVKKMEFNKDFYLDGPMGYDWIFYNEILYSRESQMYVDYESTDEGYIWTSPLADNFYFKYNVVLEVVESLYNCNLVNHESLKIINDIWMDIELEDEFHWQDLKIINQNIMEKIAESGLLKDIDVDSYTIIVEKWLFPLYTLDFQKEDVKIRELREEQNNRLFRDLEH